MIDRHFVSLGAGVQSTVMLLMADRGDITPRPEGAVFADTQWEPPAVYEHLDWLTDEVSIPVHRVTAGDLRADAVAGTAVGGYRARDGSGFVTLPLYTADQGMGRRTCTTQYKVRPIEKKVRRLCGVGYRQRFPADQQVVQWMGITTDEISRCRVSRVKWQRLRYPLIDLDMTRADCLAWFAARYPGRSLAKSACVGCPYHDNARWREIRKDADLWADVVDFDRSIRHVSAVDNYIHPARVPIDEVDLEDRPDPQYSIWEQECEGMCGV